MYRLFLCAAVVAVLMRPLPTAAVDCGVHPEAPECHLPPDANAYCKTYPDAPQCRRDGPPPDAPDCRRGPSSCRR